MNAESGMRIALRGAAAAAVAEGGADDHYVHHAALRDAYNIIAQTVRDGKIEICAEHVKDMLELAKSEVDYYRKNGGGMLLVYGEGTVAAFVQVQHMLEAEE